MLLAPASMPMLQPCLGSTSTRMIYLPHPQAVNHAILTFQPIGQSRYPYLSTNSIPLLQQYIISGPYLDAYSWIFQWLMAGIRERLLFLFLLILFFLNGNPIIAKGMLPQKGAAFFPPKMPVPPSGPSKQQNSVPRLSAASKRLVPSGANPLHH